MSRRVRAWPLVVAAVYDCGALRARRGRGAETGRTRRPRDGEEEAAMAFAVVGQPIVRDEGPAKVTGAARYTADVPLRGALWAKCLRSPYPHARIVRIDPSRAQQLPGVRAVLVGTDFPASLMGR